jgi:hypothetical protein
MNELDPRAYAHQRVAGTRPALAFPGGSDLSLKEARVWQRRLRARVRALVGLPSGAAANVPLDACVEKTKTLDGYRRETLTFASRTGLRVFGYFLVPDGVTGRRPAVLCLPGHGRGVDDIVGIGEDGAAARPRRAGRLFGRFRASMRGERLSDARHRADQFRPPARRGGAETRDPARRPARATAWRP